MKETLSGIIERVTFHNPENGFAVLRVKAKGQRGLVTVVGQLASVVAGEYVDAAGAWTQEPEHGLQFKADELRTTPPSTLAGIEKYLGSGLVKGIGPHYAKKIVEVELKQKGTELHAATVVGDTVGDPFKDTSSVALNPVIKFTTLFGLLAVELAVSLSDKGALGSVLAIVFFLISVSFVYRSFYGMRIGAEDLKRVEARVAAD